MAGRRSAARRGAAALISLLLAPALVACGSSESDPGTTSDAPRAQASGPVEPKPTPSVTAPDDVVTSPRQKVTPAPEARPSTSPTAPTSASVAPSSSPERPASREPETATASPSSASSVAVADDVLTAPAWWPNILPLPPGSRVLRVDDVTCEVDWMVAGLDLDVLAARSTDRAERAGLTVAARAAATEELPPPSVGQGLFGELGEVPVPVVRRHTTLTVRGAQTKATLAFDEMDGGVVLGRFQLVDASC